MGFVTVVGFELKDPEKEKELPRPVKVTREKLVTLDGAVEIDGTEETVNDNSLEGGFYHPR